MEIIEKIREDLNKFDRIVLIVDENEKMRKLTSDFCKSEALKRTSEKILILSASDIRHEDNANYEYHMISEEKLWDIRRLYAMYDFSDRFLVLEDKQQYGCLSNYVRTGYMTTEEIFKCFTDEKYS